MTVKTRERISIPPAGHVIGRYSFRLYDSRFAGLEDCRGDVYSQFGEDGLIESVLDRIGVTNRWCFEVGAADGEFYSNTKCLWDDGWNAVLIESDQINYAKLEAHRSERVECVHAHIGDGDLDDILTSCGAPIDLDFGVIDIDGRDYQIWQDLKSYEPRVLMIETLDTQGVLDNRFIAASDSGQASAAALIELGKKKGYKPVCRTYCNLIFLKDGA